jgi:hypothetical protein
MYMLNSLEKCIINKKMMEDQIRYKKQQDKDSLSKN